MTSKSYPSYFVPVEETVHEIPGLDFDEGQFFLTVATSVLINRIIPWLLETAGKPFAFHQALMRRPLIRCCSNSTKVDYALSKARVDLNTMVRGSTVRQQLRVHSIAMNCANSCSPMKKQINLSVK